MTENYTKYSSYFITDSSYSALVMNTKKRDKILLQHILQKLHVKDEIKKIHFQNIYLVVKFIYQSI